MIQQDNPTTPDITHATGPSVIPRQIEPSSRLAVYLASSALAITLGAGAAGFYVWDGQRALTHRIEQTVMALRDLDTSLKNDLNQGLKEMRGEQQALRNITQEIRSIMVRNHEYTAATEAEYLMRIAHHRLHLERDAASAITALEEADLRLREIDAPILIETRRQLINEITALKLVPQPDIAGAALTLSSLENQIDQLALPASSPASPATTKTGRDDSFWTNTWRELKSLVIIRRTDQTTPPLAQPEQHFFLRHNLRLTLETAQLALLRRDDATFRTNITTAGDWLGRYFEQNAATRLAQESLAKLGKMNLAPVLPDTSGSLKTLHAWLASNRADASLPPVLPATPQAAPAPQENIPGASQQ